MKANASVFVLPGASLPSRWLVHVSDAALLSLAGPSVFARGQTYVRNGAVSLGDALPLQAREQAALAATVQGTGRYETRVWIDLEDELDGACDCPHAQDGNFCKHLVALALHWRGQAGAGAVIPDSGDAKKIAAAAKRAQTQANNREALRQFLQTRSADALAARLWAWAEQDRHRMAEVKAWAVLEAAGSDAKAQRGVITELLRHRQDYLDWRESSAYARRAQGVLGLLAPWLERDPSELRGLCEHALRCLYKAAEDADDSDGEIGGLMQDVMELLLQALRAAPPPAAWLDCFMSLVKADPWGVWDERRVIDAAGPAVQARYAERAARDWMAWQASHRATPATHTAHARGRSRSGLSSNRYDPERSLLRRRYLDSLLRLDDPHALLQAMGGSTETSVEFGDIVAFCEARSLYREALQWAERGHRTFSDDVRRQDDLLRCYERDGWDKEALALRRLRLECRPDVDNYRSVLVAAERAGMDREAYRRDLFSWAEQQEIAVPGGSGRSRAAVAMPAQRVVTVRASWLLADGQLDAALSLVEQPSCLCEPRWLEKLAHRLPRQHDDAAVRLLLRVFDRCMAQAQSPYREPLALVGAILLRMPAARQQDWLARLRTQFKAKRNFIAGLPSATAPAEMGAAATGKGAF